jgi:GNAT superfamily N-acetyltransferase
MLAFRRATLADSRSMVETVQLGFEGYRRWAPRAWDPPSPAIDLARIRADVILPATWCVIAEDDGATAGHVAFTPAMAVPSGSVARTRVEAREPIPGLAHLWMLFVREPWWGTGLARELLARAVAEAAARGYAAMRLETPAGAGRARRFYEREGWELAREAEYAPVLGLEVVEYRRPLGHQHDLADRSA